MCLKAPHLLRAGRHPCPHPHLHLIPILIPIAIPILAPHLCMLQGSPGTPQACRVLSQHSGTSNLWQWRAAWWVLALRDAWGQGGILGKAPKMWPGSDSLLPPTRKDPDQRMLKILLLGSRSCFFHGSLKKTWPLPSPNRATLPLQLLDSQVTSRNISTAAHTDFPGRAVCIFSSRAATFPLSCLGYPVSPG